MDEFLPFLKKFILFKTGFLIDQQRYYFLESRLKLLQDEFKFSSIKDVVQAIQSQKYPHMEDKLIKSIWVHETSFFRDKNLFSVLESDFFVDLIKKKQEKGLFNINIWCAGCSSGQEVYSLAIMLQEMKQKFPELEFKIIGTDISEDMIARCQDGLYSTFETQRGIQKNYLSKYFDVKEEYFTPKQIIKRHTDFRVHNLLNPFEQLKNFDVIFMRNLLMYFDTPYRLRILEKSEKALINEGFLILGASETLIGLRHPFKLSAYGANIYQKLLI